mgnify:FL=1
MKKLISVIAGSFLAIMSFNVASAVEMRLGVLGNMAADFGEAKETLKDSGQISKETAVLAHSYASVFAEVALDQAAGLTFGVEYAPETIELEKETRVIPAGRTDSGSQIIDAEVEDLLTAYVALPIGETGAYVRLGYLQATLNTQETLATGSTYANVDIEGTQLGAGYMGEIGDNLFYKLEGVYNEWDNMALNGSEEGGTSGSFNKIDANITGVAARLAVGFRF